MNLHGCRREICVRKFKILSGVFYCRNFAFFHDVKHKPSFIHIHNKKQILIEKRIFIVTMQFLNNMITQIVYLFNKYGQRTGCHTHCHALPIEVLKKIWISGMIGKLRLMIKLRGFPFLIIYKNLQNMTIRNRGPPFFHDYPKDNQENMEDKS